MLVSSLRLHVGLPPVPLPAVEAVVAVSTVVSILTVAAAAVPRPRVAAGMAAMFLDLSLRQQAPGLPPAGASLVLVVLAIELPSEIKTKTNE